LQKIQNIIVNIKKTKKINIHFKIGKIILIKIIKVKILINIIIFYILNLNILFLLSLNNINKLKIKFNNLKNIFIQKKKKYPLSANKNIYKYF